MVSGPEKYYTFFLSSVHLLCIVYSYGKKQKWTEPWHWDYTRAAQNAPNQIQGLISSLHQNFRDMHILNGSRGHKGHTPSFNITAESVNSAYTGLP